MRFLVIVRMPLVSWYWISLSIKSLIGPGRRRGFDADEASEWVPRSRAPDYRPRPSFGMVFDWLREMQGTPDPSVTNDGPPPRSCGTIGDHHGLRKAYTIQ
jgi:hypothetical protein